MSLKDKLVFAVLTPVYAVMWLPCWAVSCWKHGDIRLRKCESECEICEKW